MLAGLKQPKKSKKKKQHLGSYNKQFRLELDSHADTCAFGPGVRVINEGATLEVHGYDASSTTNKATVATVAVAYDCPTTFNTYVLFFHEALYIPNMDSHLLNPFQLRHSGVQVLDVPIQHLGPDDDLAGAHTITLEEQQLHIPLSLKGTMSGFTVRTPTEEEVEDYDQVNVIHVQMTDDIPWAPQDAVFEEEEDKLRNSYSFDSSTLFARQVSPLQVRGQYPRDPSLTLEDLIREAEELSQPTYKPKSILGSSSSTASTATTDSESTIDSREIGELGLVEDWIDQGNIDPLDVDSFALPMLYDRRWEDRGLSALSRYKKRKGFVTAEKLAKNWGIGLEAAKRTIEATTQMAVRDFSTTRGTRRLKPYSWILKQKRIGCDVYTDTLHGRCMSLRKNLCMQVYTTPFYFVFARPMAKKSEAYLTLDELFNEVGIPNAMRPDNAPELTKGQFKKRCARAQCRLWPVEAYTPDSNLAEGVIRELKRHFRWTMITKNIPEVLWDDVLEWCAKVRGLTALNLRSLDGSTPEGKLTGDTSDISNMAEFGIWDWVWFLSPQDTLKNDQGEKDMHRKRLGRYLGPSDGVGEAMSGRVINSRAQRMHRTSIFPLTQEEQNSEEIKSMKKVWERVFAEKLKDRIKGLAENDKNIPEEELFPHRVEYEPYSLEELGYKEGMGFEEPTSLPELKDAEDFDLNSYIAAKVSLPRDGHTFANARVVKRARDECGDLIGRSNPDPLMDTSVYEVRFDDGAVERYSANIIAENIYSQVDKDGTTVTYIKEIVGHKKDDEAVPKSEGTVTSPNGNKRLKQTTKGWWFLVELQNGTSEWVKLKDLKESNPIEVSEYVQRNELMSEPAFAWWVPWTLKQMKRTLKAMKTRYHRTTSKFGIELPKTVKRALEIDKETGTTFWRDAITKEMKTVDKAFEVLPDGSSKPVGYNFIKCHLIFYCKAGTLQRKCRLVADGSRVSPPDGMNTYASVVSRESVRLAFLLAGLNGLNVMAADCEGAYLNAKCKERLYTKLGPEFGEREGQWAIITRAIYGSKSSASAWRTAILKVIDGLGYKMCRADNDVWMRKAVKADGTKVWEYVLVYSDDLLVVGIDPNDTLVKIDQHFKLKDGSVEVPKRYLGADISQYTCANGAVAWAMSSDSYIESAIQNVEIWLKQRGEHLKTRTACVFPSDWKPELDVTDLLEDEDASYFQQQIGVLRWMVELGRVDILTEISMLAAYSAAPRQGHLAAILHIYAYLKKHKKSKLVFDYTKIDHDPHPEYDWQEFYPDAKEKIPLDMPEPRGESVQTTCFVDSDHAGDIMSRRSRTGVLIFCNMAPILAYSKKQGSVETSSFGSEFSAMKTAVELVEGLRYKLRMMGCPLDGPTHIKADNMSVIHNCSNPASTLKKKNQSIAYHYVRERCAAGVCSVSYIPTDQNISDSLTKSQPGSVRMGLMRQVLY